MAERDLVEEALAQAQATETIQQAAQVRPERASYGPARTFIQSAAQEALPVTDEIVAARRYFEPGNTKSFEDLRREALLELQQAQEANPVAGSLGQAAGFIAPIVATGGGSLGAQALKAAAVSGAQGLAGAGEDRLSAGGIQAGVSGALTGAIGKVGQLASKADKVGTVALRALGGSGEELAALKKAGPEKVSRLLDDVGLKVSDTAHDMFSKISQARTAVGQEIGGLLQLAGQEAQYISEPILAKMRIAKELAMKNNANADRIEAAVEPVMRSFYRNFIEEPLKQNRPSFASLADLSAFQASLKAAYEGADSAVKQALKKVERAVSDSIEERVPEQLLPQYLKLKNQYSMLSLAEDAALTGVKRSDQASTSVLSSLISERLGAVSRGAAKAVGQAGQVVERQGARAAGQGLLGVLGVNE